MERKYQVDFALLFTSFSSILIRIIFAGDDLTDEDAMKALKGLAYSFRVVNSGLVQTVADHRLPDTSGVLAMLQWVERLMLEKRSHK